MTDKFESSLGNDPQLESRSHACLHLSSVFNGRLVTREKLGLILRIVAKNFIVYFQLGSRFELRQPP